MSKAVDALSKNDNELQRLCWYGRYESRDF